MKFVLVLPLLLLSLWAQAQDVVINPNITLYGRDLSNPSGQNIMNGNTSVVELNTKAGYLMPSGLFVGGQLIYERGKLTTGTMSNYYLGPTVGYQGSSVPLFVTGTVHVIGHGDFGVGTYSSTLGFQLDLGYPFEINDYFYVGPQITYKAITYKNGSNGLANTTTRQFTPYFGVWFYF